MSPWSGSQKAIAIAFSLAVHGGLLLLLLITPRPRIEPADDRGSFVVEILGRMDAGGGGAPNTPEQQFADELLKDLQSAGASASVAPSETAKQRRAITLSELFGEGRSAAEGSDTQDLESNVQKLARLAAGQVRDPRTMASAVRAPPTDKSGNVLPCWRRTDRRIPVKAVIVVDKRGAMVGRPVLQALNDSAPDPASEEEVMRAMARCAPYGPPTAAGTYDVIELDFSRSGEWVRGAGTIDVH